MPDVIRALGNVLSQDIAHMAVHADNIANINTSGFQARVGGVTENERATTQGKLRGTGRPLDIAIIGEGWLVERSADGAQFLSRNGHLRIDGDGTLRSSHGHAIQSAQGDIRVDPASAPAFMPDGSLQVRGTTVAQLWLVATPAESTRVSDGRRQSNAALQTQAGARIAAGVLEYANVDAATEMTGLMATSRHLESTQKALQLYDALLATGINQIGKE